MKKFSLIQFTLSMFSFFFLQSFVSYSNFKIWSISFNTFVRNVLFCNLTLSWWYRSIFRDLILNSVVYRLSLILSFSCHSTNLNSALKSVYLFSLSLSPFYLCKFRNNRQHKFTETETNIHILFLSTDWFIHWWLFAIFSFTYTDNLVSFSI